MKSKKVRKAFKRIRKALKKNKPLRQAFTNSIGRLFLNQLSDDERNRLAKAILDCVFCGEIDAV